jgi:hypothetical protein
MKNLLLVITLIISTKTLAIDNVKALKMALDDEYKAKATYMQVISDFGEIRPFSNIIKSEQKHIEALLPFFIKYNENVLTNDYLGNMQSYSSIKEACIAGVKAEKDNVALYDKIFSLTDDEDLINVFKNLQWASENRHLRAFSRCSRR